MLIEQTDVETAEFLEEAQLDSDPQPADNWADGDINTPEAGSFGALGAELEKLVDWVDEVDPLTGEVTRRPVLKTSKEGHRLTLNAHRKILHPQAVKELRTLLSKIGLIS
jgi:hypothetical protein